MQFSLGRDVSYPTKGTHSTTFDRDHDDSDIIEVRDANGVLSPNVLRGETNTGIVVVCVLDKWGAIRINVHGDVMTRAERHPFPLQLKRGDA